MNNELSCHSLRAVSGVSHVPSLSVSCNKMMQQKSYFNINDASQKHAVFVHAITEERVSLVKDIKPLTFHLNTLGAFSDFSFLTSSPCCATRSYGSREEEEDRGEEEVVTGGGAAGAGAAMPGL